MAYGPGHLVMDMPAISASSTLAGRDVWVERVAHLLAAAGWRITVVGGRLLVTYDLNQGDMFSYKVFGPLDPDGVDNVFWRVTNGQNGEYTHVIDEAKSNGTKPNGTYPAIVVGSTNPAATVQGIIQAIIILSRRGDMSPEGAAKPGAISVDLVINATTVRLKSNSPRNSAIGQYTAGASLNTSITSQQSYAGYICESQANTKQVLKAGKVETYGEKEFLTLAGNYQSLYMTSQVESGVPDMVYCASAQSFLPYPLDNPVIPADTVSTNRLGRTSLGGAAYGGRLARNDLYRTIAFASPYNLILHCEDAAGVTQSFINMAALKLIPTRLDTTSDLPVTELTFFNSGNVGNTSLRDQGYMSGNTDRQAINGRALYGVASFNAGTPQLLIYGSPSSAADNSPERLLWADSSGWAPDGEPWVTFSVTGFGNQGPVLGQLTDAMTIYEFTLDPNGSALYPWDGVQWKRYTKNAKEAPGNLKNPHTLCLRVAGNFNPSFIV